MATTSIAEWSTFQDFVHDQLGSEIDEVSLEESLVRFRAYQRELKRLKEKLRNAEEQSARGEGRPLDIEQFKQELQERVSAHLKQRPS